MINGSRTMQGKGIQNALTEGLGKERNGKKRVISERVVRKTAVVPPLIETQNKENKNTAPKSKGKNGAWSNGTSDLSDAKDINHVYDVIYSV